MLFSSNVFLFAFLPVSLLGYHVLGRFGRVPMFAWLSAVSLFFYGYWNPKYLFLLVGSILLNYAASRVIDAVAGERGKTVALVCAVTANLGLLIWFKYLFPLLGYFHGTGWLARDYGSVVLPLGISFFTFTQIAYLVDLKQGEAEPQDLLSYVLFVTFFPHLIAGPIIHHGEMMPQFTAQRHSGLRADDMAVGVTWFLLGLGKKVLIADRFGPVADSLYANPYGYGPQAAWLGALSYAAQLYFDFSGYSDMALGLARMFSITFPVNFNSPYKSAGIIEYWQRWHMTLSRYLGLYLFNPIAMAMTRRRMKQGKMKGKAARRSAGTYWQTIAYPILTTMFLAGIWHGAGMQFLLFGVIHGVYLAGNHAWRVFVAEDSAWQRLLPRPLSVGVTFFAVVLSDVMFRADSVRSALHVMGTMMGHGVAGAAAKQLLQSASFGGSQKLLWLALVAVFACAWTMPNTQEILGQVEETERTPSLLLAGLRWRPNVVWGVGLIAMTTVILMMMYASTSFLYFQF